MAKEEFDKEKWIRDERDFLHAIASPLMVAKGMLKIAVRKLEGSQDDLVKENLEKLVKSLNAIDQLGQQLKDRRANLISRSSLEE